MMRMTMAIFALLLLVSSSATFSQEKGLDAWLNDLSSDDQAVREAAVKGLAASGPEAVNPLARFVAGDDHTAATGARRALEYLTHRASAPGSESQRPEVAKALLAEVSGSYPVKHRQWFLRLVSFAAGEECVAGLAALLQDLDVSEMACWTLARIPGEASLKGMASAMNGASPTMKTALIQAIAHRGDPALTEALMGMVKDIHPGVRRAALEGLGRMADMEPVPLLKEEAFKGSGWEAAKARDAYFSLAERLMETGQMDLALSMYEIMFRNGPGIQDRCAGLRGWVRAGAWDVVPSLVEVIKNESPELCGVAVELLAEQRGEEATRALVEAIPQAGESARIKMIHALGRRGDRRALPVLEEALASGSEASRVAALEALGDLNDPDAAPAVIRAVLSGSGKVARSAERALSRLGGKGVMDAVVEAINDKPPSGKAALFRVLGAYRNPRALQTLITALRDEDRAVRLEAIRGLGYLNTTDAVQPLVAFLVWGGDKERSEATAAIARMRDRSTTRAVINAFDGAPDSTRVLLVTALSQRKDDKLKDFLLEASRDPCVDVVVAALEAVGRLQDPSLAPRLLQSARSDWPKEKSAALQAYIMLGEGMAQKNKAEALEIYKKALELAEGDGDKALAISRLGRLNDPAAIPVIMPFLQDGSDGVKEAAASAAAPLAVKLADDKSRSGQAIELLEAVVKLADDPGVVQNAAAKLRSMGRDVEVPVRKGYLQKFWVIGPFLGREDVRRTELVPAKGLIDLSKEIVYKDQKFKWSFYHMDHLFGMLDLLKAVAPKDDVGAFTYSQVLSDQEQDVCLRIGSDDDVFCWLNGELVHKWEGGRGWQAGWWRLGGELQNRGSGGQSVGPGAAGRLKGIFPFYYHVKNFHQAKAVQATATPITFKATDLSGSLNRAMAPSSR
jgi:HEAT repeat protein